MNDEPDGLIDGPSPEWSSRTKTVAAILLFLAVVGLVVLLFDSAGRVVVALLLAFVASYPIRLLERWNVRRGLAVGISFLTVVAGTVLAVVFGVPLLIRSLSEIDWVTIWTSTRDWLTTTLEGVQTLTLFGTTFDLSELVGPILDMLAEAEPGDTVVIDLDSILSWLSTGAEVVVGALALVTLGVAEFFIVVVMAVFFSVFLPAYARAVPELAPPAHRDDIRQLLQRMWKALDLYAGGMLKVGLFIGSVTWLGLAILGIPGAFFLGLVAGIFNVIPTLGPILAAIPGTIVALIQGSTRFPDLSNLWIAAIAIGVYTLVQQLETAVTPRIMGGSVHLSPLVVFLAVLFGLRTGGILGALVAVPLVLIGREVFRYVHAKLLDRNPFPPPEPEFHLVDDDASFEDDDDSGDPGAVTEMTAEDLPDVG